jgi:energy-coupling factor transporter ATP-binding protein EcfA2
VALEVGIVGLPSSGKTTLFRALTRAETHGSGKEHVGMAQIPDERLERLAETVGARKVTPAAVRVVDVPGTGPQLLGNLRQVDALLVVLDGFSGTRVPVDDLETLKLELLVADRDHVERRLERVGKQAKSGDARLKAEVADLERLLAHLDAGRTLAEWEGELPPELEPLFRSMRVMSETMARLRNAPPKLLGGSPITAIKDYLPGLDGLPKSDVLSYQNADGCKAIVRPSGTEPKVKVYLSARRDSEQKAVQCMETMERQINTWLA